MSDALRDGIAKSPNSEELHDPARVTAHPEVDLGHRFINGIASGLPTTREEIWILAFC
jgi:hypothetical protein